MKSSCGNIVFEIIKGLKTYFKNTEKYNKSEQSIVVESLGKNAEKTRNY